MSFITKRERVFNEYDVYDLPARNEGKLKAYSSCTDARAWSHFGSDKTEHLVEIIKKNNEMCRPKYVPTKVIVDTLLAGKNAEITRLRRRIEEFEHILSAYDILDLSPDQKYEIQKAHATIKAANKDLDELSFDLDSSCFTDASEGLETGKSRGDESHKSRGDQFVQELLAIPLQETKAVQMGPPETNEIATYNDIKDPRMQELEDSMVTKDAKLAAMKNTIAVMENDVCEPYCIYAHIYTALEIIFGTLCQNDTYKQYLNLLIADKDTRCLDIKGKIIFKLKVLEKFASALIAPCCQEYVEESEKLQEDCACYRAEVVSRVEQNFSLIPQEVAFPHDNRRACLVAEIIGNREIQNILDKQSKTQEEQKNNIVDLEECDMETENLNRLKNLQENYEVLMNTYESLKYEKVCLDIRCHKYEELEKEYESLKTKLREYDSMWNEKEHYRKRSVDLDNLKEQYLILAEETTNIESQLKAEKEINFMKCKTIEDLRKETIVLEKKLNEASISYEKEKNSLLCRLKEADCRLMCQEQQIKSLALQMERLLEHDQRKAHEAESISLINALETSKDQIRKLEQALKSSEEEKQEFQKQYEEQLELLNELRTQINVWKNTYEDTVHHNDYLEKLSERLKQDLKEKSTAVNNLMNVIEHNALQIDELKQENFNIISQLTDSKDRYHHDISSIEIENKNLLQSMQLAKQEKQALLDKVKSYEEKMNKENDYAQAQSEIENLQSLLRKSHEDNTRLLTELHDCETKYSTLFEDLNSVRQINENLSTENAQIKNSAELALKDCNELRDRILKFNLEHETLQSDNNKLNEENKSLQNKIVELNNIINCIRLSKKESDELVQESVNIRNDLMRLNQSFNIISSENDAMKKDLSQKDTMLENLTTELNNIKQQNEILSQKCENLQQEVNDTRDKCENLILENKNLNDSFNSKNEELTTLQNRLDRKLDENRELIDQIKNLETTHAGLQNNFRTLHDEHSSMSNELANTKKDYFEIVHQYKSLENELDKYKRRRDMMGIENEKLQLDLKTKEVEYKKLQQENNELLNHSQNLQRHNEDIENSLVDARNQLLALKSENPYKDIMSVIEDLIREKKINMKKIEDLNHDLNNSEAIILHLKDDLLARNEKIEILENLNNELKNEVRTISEALEKALETGEQLKNFSYDEMDHLKIMEAHHSRATHNIKSEVARLQVEKSKLEEQLTKTKVTSNDFSRDKNKYISQIIQLQNEREMIVSGIKDLELRYLGDSDLIPENCEIKDILFTLDRIKKCLEAKSSKSSSLEQTLLKVQTSSQILLNKADEAKKIVEREKEKIIFEKEEAIKDRQIMENQLLELREKLEKQIVADEKIIKDLEATILNQKLIIDKINQSTDDYISKLNAELQDLKELYQSSLKKIEELQEHIKTMSEDKDKQLNKIENITSALEEKSKEIAKLQKELHDLSNCKANFEEKSKEVVALQKELNSLNKIKDNFKEKSNEVVALQKEINEINKIKTTLENKYNNEVLLVQKELNENKKKTNHDMGTQVEVIYDKGTQKQEDNFEDFIHELKPTETSGTLESSILTTYINTKIQRLNFGKLEHCSISCDINKDINEKSTQNETNFASKERRSFKAPTQLIYYGLSNDTSSKSTDELEPIGSKPAYHNIVESFKTPHSKNNESKIINKNKIDKDPKQIQGQFVIYKENEPDFDKNIVKDTLTEEHSANFVDDVSVQPIKQRKFELSLSKNKEGDSYDYVMLDESDNTRTKFQMSPVKNTRNVGNATNSLNCNNLSNISNISSPRSFSTTKVKVNENAIETDVHVRKSPSLPTMYETKDQFVDDCNLLEQSSIEELMKYETFKKKTLDGNNEFYNPMHGDSGIGTQKSIDTRRVGENFGYEYISNSIQAEVIPKQINYVVNERECKSEETLNLVKRDNYISSSKESSDNFKIISNSKQSDDSETKSLNERSILTKTDISTEEYENKIRFLTASLNSTRKNYERKIEALKKQYDNHIKNIINEHNSGVKSIQCLHEETLQDILKVHENEIENLRSMSIEAMQKSEKLEKENKILKSKYRDSNTTQLDKEPVKMSVSETKKKKKSKGDAKILTKTIVEAFNVKPKALSPCACSIDTNLSDTIRNIFEQVDVEQRKSAERTYIKYIANKILAENVEKLDIQELSFLHLKICRTWKSRINKEEALQKRIATLETELLHKQRNTQQHIEELDRKVAEERQRLQTVRDAMCRISPTQSRGCSPTAGRTPAAPPVTPASPEIVIDMASCCMHEVEKKRSAGDTSASVHVGPRGKRVRPEHRAVHVNLDRDDRREKKLYNDEPPTRLRRAHDKRPPRKL